MIRLISTTATFLSSILISYSTLAAAEAEAESDLGQYVCADRYDLTFLNIVDNRNFEISGGDHSGKYVLEGQNADASAFFLRGVGTKFGQKVTLLIGANAALKILIYDQFDSAKLAEQYSVQCLERKDWTGAKNCADKLKTPASKKKQ